MFDGHYKEKEASVIPVPNIEYQVFEAMMRAIYTGDVLKCVLELLMICSDFLLHCQDAPHMLLLMCSHWCTDAKADSRLEQHAPCCTLIRVFALTHSPSLLFDHHALCHTVHSFVVSQ